MLILTLQIFVQHKGWPGAFCNNSSECYSEIDSSFLMQRTIHYCSNHLVCRFVPCNFFFLEIWNFWCVIFQRSNLKFQHCALLVSKNHDKHTGLLKFQAVGGSINSQPLVLVNTCITWICIHQDIHEINWINKWIDKLITLHSFKTMKHEFPSKSMKVYTCIQFHISFIHF